MGKLLHERLAEWIEKDPIPDSLLLNAENRRFFYEELLNAIKRDYIPKNKEMPMKKLLHERLRECKHKTDYLDLDNTPGVLISKQTAKELADEIERYYIPRQRDNKGIPFFEGDTVWSIDPETEYSAEVVTVYPKTILIRWEDGAEDLCEGVDLQHEPPQPKVLDSDGVEIKVGDTVWLTVQDTVGDDSRFTVAKIESSNEIYITPDEGLNRIISSNLLTHKEPDSLEKLCHDMMEHHENWESDPNEWLEMATRLSALIEKAD